ncbi:hypothetical protein [Haloarcula marina]|uniref:hypothetical protein n=1 Tax=Haloarcula marina TaxID=2961574 RepID=UPI0020B808AB|nr:hypothetical protein [Halomicroarcula marina]
MFHTETTGLLLGAIALGAVHGVEPGHGWPVAASYALERTNKWVYGLAASFIIGVGHLVSSIAMVAVFFYAKAYFDLTQVNDPLTIAPGVEIGGPVSVVAGVVLLLLGVREYRHGHSHAHSYGDEATDDHGHGDAVSKFDHGEGHTHEHESGHIHDHDDGHTHDGHGHVHGDDGNSVVARIRAVLTFGGGHSHETHNFEDAADRGMWGIAWFAFLLGFAHEEEFEIIALCAGSNHCLELMTAYALTVIVGIVGLTLLLLAGYTHFEETVEQYTPYLPLFSAVVLVGMGIGFVLGVF